MKELTMPELAELMGVELQPYQQSVLNQMYGIPVRAFQEGNELFIINTEAITPTRRLFISTPRVQHDWFEDSVRFKMNWWAGWVDEERVPERPSSTDLARWADDGGR